MTDEQRAVVAYRMHRAREAIEAARLLFDAGHLNDYVNRLYYACFYAVSAPLLTKGLPASKHRQVRALMHRECLRTGLIAVQLAKHFDRLFDSRLSSDYGDLVRFSTDEVAGWLEPTRLFVSHVEGLLAEGSAGVEDGGDT